MSGQSTGRILILVVERDPHIRELEAHFLNEAGYAVEFATDGRAALEQALALPGSAQDPELAQRLRAELAALRNQTESPRRLGDE